MRALALVSLGLLVAGCAAPRYAFEPVAGPVAQATAAEIEAGEALYPFRAPSGQWGYMDAQGRVVLQPTFPSAEPFSEGRAIVRTGEGVGFIDPSGRAVGTRRFADAEAFSQGRALVAVGEGTRLRYGFVDAAGAVVVPLQLGMAHSYSDGRALVQIRTANLSWLQKIFQSARSETVGFIGLDGTLVFDLPGDAASFSDGLAPFSDPSAFSAGSWGYVRPDGSVAIPPSLRSTAFRFREGLARVTEGDSIRFIGPSGAFAFPASFALARSFSDGLAAVRVGERWGYVDTTGALAVEPRFRRAGDFAEGLAAVDIEGRWGFIDRAGEIVIEPAYRAAQAFRGGLAYVTDASGAYYIDAEGRPVRPRLDAR